MFDHWLITGLDRIYIAKLQTLNDHTISKSFNMKRLLFFLTEFFFNILCSLLIKFQFWMLLLFSSHPMVHIFYHVYLNKCRSTSLELFVLY